MIRSLVRIGSWLRGAWLFVGLLLLCLLGVDALLAATVDPLPAQFQVDPGAGRHSKGQAGVFRNERWYREYRREFKRSRRLEWRPYVYWRHSPFDGRHVNIDAEGIRSTWAPADLGDDPPRVFVFGGSTVWGTGARDDYTLPSQIARHLVEAGESVRVTNFGEFGYVLGQELILLVTELKAGNVPDLAIFYDGVNDVIAALQNGVAGLPQQEMNRRLEFNASRYPDKLLQVAGRQLNGVSNLTQRLLARERDEASLDSLAQQIAADYAQNVGFIERLAASYDFEVLFYWQPTIFSKNVVTAYERRQRDARQRQHRSLQLASSDAIRRSLAPAAGTRFRDLSGVLDDVEDPLYLDFCHLGEEGNRLVAAAIAEDAIPALRRRSEARRARR